MLNNLLDRSHRAARKVRVLSDDSFVVRGNVSQLHRPEVWR